MCADRLDRIRRRLSPTNETSMSTARLCQVCAEVTEMSGAGIMLMDGDLPQGTVCTTNPVSALIEELQFTLGEGPCVDAYRLQHPIAEPDLADPEVPRWLGFTPPAVAAGARAVFGFPLHLGGARLGALTCSETDPAQ